VTERENKSQESAAPSSNLGAQELEQLAAEGLKLRRELEERMARMKAISTSDLQARSR